jgi:orotate phosphoribosyltransferase
VPDLPSGAASLAPRARLTARTLLETRSILVRPDEPFTFTSGRLSPVYVDCRRLISFPRARARLMAMAAEQLGEEAGLEAFDAVAGGETAGIPFAAWLADRLALPMLYVRKKPKGFGRDARIEGVLAPGQRVLLVEDLMTDGGSKVDFVSALREAGAQVGHASVLFRYGVFAGDALADLGVAVHALATWSDVLAVAETDALLSAEALAEVRGFLTDPDGWSAAHGGPRLAAGRGRSGA